MGSDRGLQPYPGLDEANKNNNRINRRTMNRFRRTVAELELLDRALASLEWEERFPNCHLQALGSDASDHCPLLLQTNL